ncbi:MAG TPA: hypothetical protein VIC08_11425, partial [Cellvibrionaceae bacterium]
DRDLLALPGVLEISRQRHTVSLHTHSTEQSVSALLQQDPQLTELEVRPVALEQAFLQLTQKTQSTQEPVA